MFWNTFSFQHHALIFSKLINVHVRLFGTLEYSASLVQLNKCETDPYFLQNFQCTTMFISVFCKICELNTEHEIVFVFCNVYLLALDFRQIPQNQTEKIILIITYNAY